MPKTVKDLLEEISTEVNAIKSADMGMEAAEAFAQDALDKFRAGDVVATEAGLKNLVQTLGEIRKAIPASVIPATAGPVGKSPHEQYLEQAAGVVQQSLSRMQAALGPVAELLKTIDTAVQEANQATAAINSPDLKTA